MKIKPMIYQTERKCELLYKGTHKNYNYYILNLGTHPTAYIEIPKGTKLYGKDYHEIYDICDIDVHGGLTYSASDLIGEKDNSWFIGWDYAHVGDYMGYYADMKEWGLNSINLLADDKKWTTEEIIEECKSAIEQIIDLESEVN